jgi:hypothetical protein
MYHGMYVQDDWKVTDKLTVNLGLRYEYEAAPSESQDRIARGFDPSAQIAIANAAQAQYAASPIAEVPVSAFRVQGGMLFASSSDRQIWSADKNNIEPRVGFAYSVNSKTAIRGGLGVYAVPFIFSNGIAQPGYSQSTSIQPTANVGLTFQATMANPFHQGVIQPAGNSAGPNTSLGQGLPRLAPNDFQNAQNMRYSIGMQRELPGQWLLDVAYVGSRGYDIPTEVDLNAVPAQYLSTSRFRDQSQIDTNTFLGAQVVNPFRGLIPGTGHNNAQFARSNLLRPYPQFTGVSTWDNEGTSTYNSWNGASVRVTR